MFRTATPLLRGRAARRCPRQRCHGTADGGGAELAAPLLGLPRGLLFWSGLGLLPFALLLGWIARRRESPEVAAKAVVALNLAWVAGSALVLALLPGEPTGFGYAFITLQALAVLALAAAQWIGLTRTATRRSRDMLPRKECKMQDKGIVIVGGLGKTGRRIFDRLNGWEVEAYAVSRSSTPAFDWDDRVDLGGGVARRLRGLCRLPARSRRAPGGGRHRSASRSRRAERVIPRTWSG